MVECNGGMEWNGGTSRPTLRSRQGYGKPHPSTIVTKLALDSCFMMSARRYPIFMIHFAHSLWYIPTPGAVIYQIDHGTRSENARHINIVI